MCHDVCWTARDRQRCARRCACSRSHRTQKNTHVATKIRPPKLCDLRDLLVAWCLSLTSYQAIKVLDTYCANVQRQGSGRIQNKAAYLMSLIQSYKLGPASGTTGSAQRLMERLSPAVSQAVQAVFDPVVDRVVLEDRALMELLAKVPEDQVRARGSQDVLLA